MLSPDEVLAAYDAVTAHDVQRVAQTLFTANGVYLAAVGPFGDGVDLGSLLSLE
jgi:predicted Zn-dependent peptidase